MVYGKYDKTIIHRLRFNNNNKIKENEEEEEETEKKTNSIRIVLKC